MHILLLPRRIQQVILRKTHILFRSHQRRLGSLVPIPPLLTMIDRAGLVETVKGGGSSIVGVE